MTSIAPTRPLKGPRRDRWLSPGFARAAMAVRLVGPSQVSRPPRPGKQILRLRLRMTEGAMERGRWKCWNGGVWR